MPLVRFEIRNELSLGGPELNRSPAVEYEEPKAILGAVEVAGLVGILRQLGDLAEFSAEVFNGIQEEVTVTASRCQKLTSRVKRIDSALSPLEKAVLSQTSHIHFAYTAGCEWHPRIRNGQRHFVQSDLPLCVMETYEQCRDPPPLHLLDRFDAGGPGSCLRKYSDPTFFRKEVGNHSKADDVKSQKDQTHRKRKKKRLPQRNICRSRAVSTSDDTNGARLSSLTDDIPTTSQSTSTVDMPRSSNMQDLSGSIDQSHLQEQSNSQEQSEAQVQSDLQESSRPRDSITGSGYIEYVINHSPVNKPDVKLLEGSLPSSLQPADRIGSAVPQGRVEVVDDNILCSPSKEINVPYASIVCDEKKEALESKAEKSNKDEEASEIHEPKIGPGTPDRVKQNQRDFDRTYDFFDEVCIVGEKQSKSQDNSIDEKPRIESEEENTSEADEFVDARNTIESESESELDGIPKPKLEHYFGDISTYCSEDASSDNNGGSEDIPFEELVEDPRHDNSLDESCSVSYPPDDASVSCCQSDPVCGKVLSHDETFRNPREFSAMRPWLAGDCASEKISFEELISSDMSLKDAIPAEKILPEEHLANYPSLAEAVSHEKSLPGESVAKYPSFAEIVPSERIFPENSLPEIRSLAEAVPENMAPAEEPGAAHPSFPKAVQENKISPEVLDSTDLSGTVPEAVSEEQISFEGSVSVSPCLAEVFPDERFLTEEPEEIATAGMSSSKVMSAEKLFPETTLEAPQDLPEENILREKSVDYTHPSCAKAVSPKENLSPQVLDSANLSVAEAVSHEQIRLEESGGICPCSAEAVPDENFLTEEREEAATTCIMSSSKVMPVEKFLPEKPLEAYHYLPELPQEKMLAEESVSSAPPDENLSPEVLDSTNVSAAEAVPQEQIGLEEFLGIDAYLAKAVPDERGLPEEPVTTWMSLTKAEANEKNLPEEPLERYPPLAELPEENIFHEETGDATHSSESVIDEKISPEVSSLSLEETLPQEKISLEEFVGIDPCLAEAVPDERLLPEEAVTTCLFLRKAATIEEVLPEKPLETYPSFDEFPDEKIMLQEADDAIHLSVSEAVSDEQVSPEVPDSTNFPAAIALPQEQIVREEFVGNPCMTEAVPDKRVLPEEPVTTCLSLTKAATIEGALPEEPLETYPPFAELPEEKIVFEEADDATHSSVSEAISDEQISPEVLHSEKFPAAAPPQEQIALEEFVGNLCLTDAALDKRGLPEEPVTTCPSLTKAATIEEVLPEKPLETYFSFAELPEETIVQDEADYATHPSVSGAGNDEKISPEVLDSTFFPVAAALPQEQILLDEFVGNPYRAEAVPDSKVLPEESVTTGMSSMKPQPIQELLPEEPVEAYVSLEKSPEDETSQEKSDDDTRPSCAEAESNKNIVQDVLDSEILSVSEAITQEKIELEEFVGVDPCFAEAISDERVLPEKAVPDERVLAEEAAVPGERFLPEEAVTTSSSLTKVAPIVKILPEGPLDMYPSLEELPEEKISEELELNDDTHPCISEAVGDEKISLLEQPGSTYPSLEESVPPEKTSDEETGGTNPFLELAVPNVSSFQDNQGVALQSSAEAVSKEKNLPEESLLAYFSLAEDVFDEKTSGSEAPGYTTEAGPHYTEEPIATDLSLDESISDKELPGLEAPAPTTKTGPHNKSFPEEPVATYLSLAEAVPEEKISLEEIFTTCPPSAEAVFDEEISGAEAPGYTTVAGPHNTEEPVATDLSLTESVFDEKIPGLEAPVSTAETGLHNKTFTEEPVATYPSLEEPVPDDNVLPKEPAPAFLDLSEGIPDQQVFLDDAAFLSFAEAIFDQKFSPEVPDSMDLPSKDRLGKEVETSDDTIVEPVNIWSNGGLLGLAPSKPPVFAEPKSVSEHIQNEISEASVIATTTRKQGTSSRSVEDTEKSSLPLVVSDPGAQKQSNMLSHSNGSLSPLQSTATSFKVFGLSHRLLMAGFRGNSSSTYKFESIPTTSYDTKAAAIEDKTQQTPSRGPSFEEQLAYESSLFGSTSSPPVEHMKISFNPIDPSPVSKLKLRIPCQPQYNGENVDTFPSFQLVPEASNSDNDDDENSDIFCQSSPGVSDNCLSDSELWESDESPRESASRLKQGGQRSTHGDMGSFPEIIRDWPPNQPNENAVLKKTQT
ncbi:Scar-like domain-containing protein WAVE 5 [Raphanus sativus]|nr:Scar-like domain-containing protein WAVE 5 [Raphanus sativus]